MSYSCVCKKQSQNSKQSDSNHHALSIGSKLQMVKFWGDGQRELSSISSNLREINNNKQLVHCTGSAHQSLDDFWKLFPLHHGKLLSSTELDRAEWPDVRVVS